MPSARGRFLPAIFVAFFLLVATVPAPAATPPGKEAVLSQARALIDGDEMNRENMRVAADLLGKYAAQAPEEVRFPLYQAEAWYRMADPQAEIEQNYPLYEKAGEFAEKALQVDPEKIEGAYWYGLTRLKKAQKVGGIRAYFIAREGIKALERVRTTRPGYDHGGAARVLGLLYTVAPGWTPFGDLEKAIAYTTEAVGAAPAYPLNYLYLARACLKAGKPRAASTAFRKIIDLEPNRFAEEARVQLKRLEARG